MSEVPLQGSALLLQASSAVEREGNTQKGFGDLCLKNGLIPSTLKPEPETLCPKPQTPIPSNPSNPKLEYCELELGTLTPNP